MFNSVRRGFFRKQKQYERVSPKTPRQAMYKKITYATFGGLGLMLWTNFYKTQVEVKYTPTDFNQIALAHIPELRKPYATTFYLPFRLWELIMGARLERPPYLKVFDEEIPLKDGDVLQLGKFISGGLSIYFE